MVERHPTILTKLRLWRRLELGAYDRLKTELPWFEEEFKLRGNTDNAWVASVRALLETANARLHDQPEIAWRCYRAAVRTSLLGLEENDPNNKIEICGTTAEVLHEAKEKLKNWRGDAIRSMLSDEQGVERPDIAPRTLIRAQRLLDEHHFNLRRKMRVLMKRLRVLETVGLLLIASGVAFWPYLALTFDPLTPDLRKSWIGLAVALMGLTGAVVSGFSDTKGVSDARVPLQEAEFAIMIGRLVFGTLSALAVVWFLASGMLKFGPQTAAGAMAVAFAAGFSERLVLSAVNAFGKE
jgi:hypothetical protein